VPGLTVEPQVPIVDGAFFARVDLADEQLKIVIEADSLEFHGSPKAFGRDCRRYNGLVARGWLVVRFTWIQVMFEPGLVAETVRAVVELRRNGGRSGGTRVVRTAKTA